MINRRHRSIVAAVFFALSLGALQRADGSTAAVVIERDVQITWVYQPDDTHLERQSRCRGVLIGGHAILTVRHCVPVLGGKAELICADGSALMARSRYIHGHAEADLAYIAFEPSQNFCGVPKQVLNMVNSVESSRFSWLANGKIRMAGPDQADLDNPYVIRLQDAPPCLRAGDSGAGLFAAASQGRIGLAGILINGEGRCPGEQTYLRLAPYRDWINQARSGSLPPEGENSRKGGR